MAKNQPRLGRGLSTLIHAAEISPEPAIQTESPAGQAVLQIRVSSVRPSAQQPRKTFDDQSIAALAESIRKTGILQPVLVRADGAGGFELIAGERRWRAAQAAGLEEIPAIVRQATSAEAFELALIENLQREDLNPLERAAAYRHYIEAFRINAEELAGRIGESRANVSNYLRILNLSEEIRRLVASGELGMGQARAIAGIDDPQRQISVAKLAVRRRLAVRQVEALARSAEKDDTSASTETAVPRRPAQMNEVEQALSRSLGLTVKLHAGKKKNSGRVVIYYGSLDDFDRVAERICGQKVLE